jgi:hypothetical protein
MSEEEFVALRANLLDALADRGLTVYDGEHDRWIGPSARLLIETVSQFRDDVDKIRAGGRR